MYRSAIAISTHGKQGPCPNYLLSFESYKHPIKMVPEDSSEKQLDIQLYREDNDDEEIFYKGKLEALINSDKTPSAAAADFDAFVVQETHKRLTELLKRPDPRHF